MKTYTIRDGFSFRMDDNSIKTGGETIELDDDAAALHLHKLEEVAVDDKSASKKPKSPVDPE